MNVKHINNSFFIIKTKATKLVCDPWIGEMENTGTWSFPNLDNNKKILNKIKPDYIYISHLHYDHFDKEILKNYKQKKTKIIIKKFNDERLKNNLIRLGYKNIIELNSWQSYTINDLEVTMVPCDSSNSANIYTEINYDLDTSLIIFDKKNKVSFYNNVDNPLSLKAIKKVKNHVYKKYGKLDILSAGPRGASEYPQCFLNVNRVTEKRKIIQKCINRVDEIIKILKPKYLIPAGGSYIIFGKFHKLQKYVAHPTIKELEKHYSKFKNLNLLNLDCGSSIDITHNKASLNVIKSQKKLNKQLNTKTYFYNKIDDKKINLIEIFNEAKNNYLNKLKKLKIKNNWIINFYLYNNLKLFNNRKIDKQSSLTNKFSLFNDKYKKKSQVLNCYMDRKLFITLLTKKSFNWNLAIGGSIILMERYPNKFIPDVPFSLNFLRT